MVLYHIFLYDLFIYYLFNLFLIESIVPLDDAFFFLLYQLLLTD